MMERGGSTDRPAHITSDAASRYQICNHTQALESTDMCNLSAFIFYLFLPITAVNGSVWRVKPVAHKSSSSCPSCCFCCRASEHVT